MCGQSVRDGYGGAEVRAEPAAQVASADHAEVVLDDAIGRGLSHQEVQRNVQDEIPAPVNELYREHVFRSNFTTYGNSQSLQAVAEPWSREVGDGYETCR